MPAVNPEILVWARETAGLTPRSAAKKLGFGDSSRSSSTDKLADLEEGVKEPTRPQLLKMADQYRRPLLTFYLSQPPEKASRGADFRTLHRSVHAEDEARMDALVRDIRARQSMVRALLVEEDEAEPLPFIGAHRMEDGSDVVLSTLRAQLALAATEYRSQSDVGSAFNLLRRQAEASGIFVILKGDLGNYLSVLDTAVFRGFSLADDVAPFIVINEYDARSAWSFTLLHEAVHLLLGQTGACGANGSRDVEQFCDDVAGEFLLPDSDFMGLAVSELSDFSAVYDQVGTIANRFKVSRTMVAYKAMRSGFVATEMYGQISGRFRAEWQAQREAERERRRESEASAVYYPTRRHRLGGRILGLISRMVAAQAISTSKAAQILGVRARNVGRLLSDR